MVEANTRDMASPNWLKWKAFFSARKKKSMCDWDGARPQIERETLLSNSLAFTRAVTRLSR